MATDEGSVTEIPKVRVADVKFDETPIGRGGYGYVYRGEHKDLGTVAVKTMIADGLLPARHLRVFKAEGKKLWELNHTSIVRLLALIMEENNYSLVLEYMHFGSLTAFRQDFPNCDWSLIVSIIRDVIHGMDYLHGSDPPILHLDLKSDNILINRRIRAKITDFGLSQWKTMTRTMTRGGEGAGRKGTVTHVPPEVWNNINTLPNKAYDVYSFGIVLWETIMADRPFAHVGDDIIPKAVLSGQRPDLTSIPASCPREVVNLMTASWVQQPDKRIEFSAMMRDIDTLFEKMAPKVPEGLKKLEKEIQELYSAEDLGGDTVATADSESLFDAATKLSKPLTAPSTSPPSVEMTEPKKEEPRKEEPMAMETSSPSRDAPEQGPGPSVPKCDSPMEEGTPVKTPSGDQAQTQNTSQTEPKSVETPAASTSSAAQAPTATSTTAGSTSSTTGSFAPTSTSGAATTGASTSSVASTTTTTSTSSTTSSSSAAPMTAAAPQAAPQAPAYVMSEEEKKALRRVVRDPVGMLLMHKDATLCQRVFGVELEFQKKIKDSGELLKLLEQDPLLRLELQRKGPDHIGWLFNPHRMKDEIRRKRPARQPKPEAVERMKKLKQEREKREEKKKQKDEEEDENPRDPREFREKDKKGGLSGLMGFFKGKDKSKREGREDMRDPYMDPMMMDMMGMRMRRGMGSGISHDLVYKLKSALKESRMVRVALQEEAAPRISSVDREVLEILQDPDRLLSIMQQEPSLMTILATTDKDAFMKIVARARGGSSRSRNARSMMDRGPRRMRGMYPDDLERDMMDMDLEDEMMMRMMMDGDRFHRHRKDRQLMEMLKNPGHPKDRQGPSSSSSSSKPSSTASSSDTTPKTTSPSTSTGGATPKTTTASSSQATSNTSTSSGNSKGKETTGGKSADDRPEISSLPADHLVKRQEREILSPVQRNTDTEPLQTHFGGLNKGFLSGMSGGAARSMPSSQSSDEPNNVSTSQSASPMSGHRKRSQDYMSKWNKLAKKHKASSYKQKDTIIFDHVHLISENIGEKWIDLAKELDMRPNKLRDLVKEQKSSRDLDDYDCCMRVLQDLVNRKPYYTLEQLINNLKPIGCQKIAIQLIQLLE